MSQKIFFKIKKVLTKQQQHDKIKKRKEVLNMIWFLFSGAVAAYNMIRFAKTDNLNNYSVCGFCYNHVFTLWLLWLDILKRRACIL